MSEHDFLCPAREHPYKIKEKCPTCKVLHLARVHEREEMQNICEDLIASISKSDVYPSASRGGMLQGISMVMTRMEMV